MSNDMIRNILESEVLTKFAPLQPSVPVRFLNTRYETPTVPWIHVAVLPNITGRANIGAPSEFQAIGVVNVTCMVPENTGTKIARQIADSLESILIDRQISIPAGGHITIYSVAYRDRGVVNGWYTVNVIASYRARVRLDR